MSISMTIRGRIVAVACWILVFSAPALAGDSETITTLTQEWVNASAKADIEAYFSFTTDDFAWIGDRNDSGFRGREEVQAFVEPFFETTSFSLDQWETDDLVFSGDGDQAIHIWSGRVITIDKEGGGRTAIDRTYVDFWSKQLDGKWLCTRHTFVVLGVSQI